MLENMSQPSGVSVTSRPCQARLRSSTAASRRAKTAGLAAPEPSLHDLRHSHASMLIALDVPVVDVQRRLGHRKPDTTLRVYAHQWKEREARRSQVGQQLGQLFERRRELTAPTVTRLALPPAPSHA
jgi:hypothetical protein